MHKQTWKLEKKRKWKKIKKWYNREGRREIRRKENKTTRTENSGKEKNALKQKKRKGRGNKWRKKHRREGRREILNKENENTSRENIAKTKHLKKKRKRRDERK